MVGGKARPLGQVRNAMCKFRNDMLGDVAAIIAYREDGGLVIMSAAANRPSVEGFDPVHLACVQQLFQCAIDRRRRRYPIRPKTF